MTILTEQGLPQRRFREPLVHIGVGQAHKERVSDQVPGKAVEQDPGLGVVTAVYLIAEENPFLFKTPEQALIPVRLTSVEDRLRIIGREPTDSAGPHLQGQRSEAPL